MIHEHVLFFRFKVFFKFKVLFFDLSSLVNELI